MSFITDWFLAWWLRSGRYRWSRMRRWLFERHHLSTTLPSVSSLDDIETCLKQITWTMDGLLHLFDSISYPQTVWTTKKDDCDGFAILAATLLRQWDSNCKPVLLTVLTRPVRRSHTVCVFSSSNSSLRVFDNSRLHQMEYRTYQDIALTISQNTQKLVFWDVRDPETFEMIAFHKL